MDVGYAGPMGVSLWTTGGNRWPLSAKPQVTIIVAGRGAGGERRFPRHKQGHNGYRKMNGTDPRTVRTLGITTSYPQAVHKSEGPDRHCDDRGPSR